MVCANIIWVFLMNCGIWNDYLYFLVVIKPPHWPMTAGSGDSWKLLNIDISEP